MSFDSVFHTIVTLVNALMAVIPNVPWWVFPVYVLPGGWAVFLLALVIYIELLRGSEDRVLRRICNAFWLYNAAATVAFILTRESLLAALGYFLVASIVFAAAFANFVVIRDRWVKADERWKRVLGYWAGGSLLLVGFPYDVNFSLTWGRAMLLQKPRLFDPSGETPWKKVFGGDWTFTANLKRNLYDFTWQGIECRFICRRIVEFWDPSHCGLAMSLRAVR